jgi:arylsulfatase A-like enzyme
MSRVLTGCLAVGLVSILSSVALADVPASGRRPSIVVIFADDLGYGDPGCYGGRLVPTPNLDRFAREGARFTQFYAASPICSASRVGLTTGMDPARWRITSYLQTRAGNRQCDQADWLDPAAPTLPRTLKEAGYATGHFGKWHMGGGRDVVDAPSIGRYGFDEWVSTWESPDPHPKLGVKFPPWQPETEPGQVPRHERTAFLVDRTLDFIGRHAGAPFYVNFWPDDIHTPHTPAPGPDGQAPTEPMERYVAVMAEFDRQVGRLLDGLRAAGVDRETIVLFAGDNGPEPTFDHARTGGLRGGKWSLYEGGIRVPLLVRWPGVVPAGTVDDSSVLCAVDLFPSLCSMAGVPRPEAVTFDGEDLAPALLGKPTTRARPLFWEYGRKPPMPGQKGLGAFPYPKEPNDLSPNVAVRDGAWKLLINADGTRAELYDLEADPKETTNRTKDRPDIARRLEGAALAWRRSLP